MQSLTSHLAALAVSLPLAISSGQARDAATNPPLHPLFSDHAVLQRERPLPVWGWAAPGTRVAVSLAGKSADATAGADGRWEVTLPALKAGGPFVLGAQIGTTKIERQDVLIGEVRLCCGQSNMAFTLRNSSSAKADVPAATNPQLRMFQVPAALELQPQKLPGAAAWARCSPESAATFSAVAYYFGAKLQSALGVPVGLVNASYGGSTSHAWISENQLASRPDTANSLGPLHKQRVGEGEINRTWREMQAWFAANDVGTPAGREQRADFTSTAKLPGSADSFGLKSFPGVVRLRRDFTADENMSHAESVLTLRGVDVRSGILLNGEALPPLWWDARRFVIPAGRLKVGGNQLMLRAILAKAEAKAEPIAVRLDAAGQPPLPLDGDWQNEISTPLADLPALPHPDREFRAQVIPSVLFNGMLAPLEPGSFRGALWYQGETNNVAPDTYRRVLLGLLIGEWRVRFRNPDLAFGIVQLPNYSRPSDEPVTGGWPDIRAAQAGAAQEIPHAFLGVNIDVGDVDVHPHHKRPVGERLARRALAVVHGATDPATGPQVADWKVQGGTVRVTFKNTGGRLEFRPVPGNRSGFALAGADGTWHWADLELAGEAVLLTARGVPIPTAVRYAWSQNPPAPLYGGDGLPAAPFRLDAR